MGMRHVYAMFGFALGLGLALLVGAILQADSGNTYQIYHGGIPGDTFTVSWGRGATGILVVILGGLGLISLYDKGTQADASGKAQEALMLAGWWDIGLTALVALFSSPLRTRLLPLFGQVIDPAQVALVATAIVLGPGAGLLAGGAGLVMGTALGVGPKWYSLVMGLFGSVEGIVTAWLARSLQWPKLLLAGAAAALLTLLSSAVWLGVLRSAAGSRLFGLMLSRALISAAIGVLIGWALRKARTRPAATAQGGVAG